LIRIPAARVAGRRAAAILAAADRGRTVHEGRSVSRFILAAVALLSVTAALPAGGAAFAQEVSPNGVRTLAPPGAIKPTGTWSVATRAGEFIYVAGMRGIDPATDALVPGDEARVRQAFLNMKLIVESEGATLRDAVRLVVFVTDMFRYRPIVNKIQAELWGQGPYPPRTIIEVERLNQDDIVEVEGTFHAKGLTAQEKNALFRQFIQWRARQNRALQ
jgi:2-iminobutanoate/2-iminopropanoate deaminase